MTYCRRCRVVIAHEDQTLCPLCNHELVHQHQAEDPQTVFYEWKKLPWAQQHEPFWYVPQPVSSKKIINVSLDFLMLSVLCAIMIVATVDLYQYNLGRTQTLFIYIPSVSLLYALINLAIIRFYRFALRAQWLILVNTILFLIGLDIYDQQLDWSIHHGLIITLGGVGPLLLLQLLWRYVNVKGLNMIGFTCIVLAISLLSLDGGISSGWRLQGWSLFSFSSLIFLALLFLYMHYIAKIIINFTPIFKVKREKNKDTKPHA